MRDEGVPSALHGVAGTVRLAASKTVLIPSPSPDPKDPLNFPLWLKSLVIVNVAIFSATTLALVGGLGGIIGLYAEQYRAEGYNARALDYLVISPVLTMGIGCLLGFPLSEFLGRRPIYAIASVLALVANVICATSSNYIQHIIGRMLLGLAAGQSEVLVPIIVQCFFLHQRSRCLLAPQVIQTCVATALTSTAGIIATKLSPQWWYGIGACLCGFQSLLTLFFHPETLYDRPEYAFAGIRPTLEARQCWNDSMGSDLPEECYSVEKPNVNRGLDGKRWLIEVLKPRKSQRGWSQVWVKIRNMFRMLRLPLVIWAIVVNGFSITPMLATSIAYATVLSQKPFNWSSSYFTLANISQVIVILVAIPVLGYGSDLLVSWKARRNGGVHEPEIRIIPIIVPVMIGILCNALFSAAAVDPGRYSWFLYVWALASNIFLFIGVNIVSFTYLLDSCVQSAGYMLSIVCACRNFLGVILLLGLSRFLTRPSYHIVFLCFTALTVLGGILDVGIFIYGKKLRRYMLDF